MGKDSTHCVICGLKNMKMRRVTVASARQTTSWRDHSRVSVATGWVCDNHDLIPLSPRFHEFKKEQKSELCHFCGFPQDRHIQD